MSYREHYGDVPTLAQDLHDKSQRIRSKAIEEHMYTRGLKAEQINHPSHYTRGQIECIEAQRSALSPEEYRGYLKGCAIAYLWREKHKGGQDDIKKASWFLARLEETYGYSGTTGLGDAGGSLNPKTA